MESPNRSRPAKADLLEAARSERPILSERVRCEHADRCGGCPIIALPYGEQLALKRGRVLQSASRYPTLELVYTEPVVAAEPIVAYRTRAKLMVAPGPKLGLYAKGGGHQVVDIPHCRVLSSAIADVTRDLRDLFAEAEAQGGALAPFDPLGRGAVRAVDLREIHTEAGPRVLLTFVVHRNRIASLEALEEAARAYGASSETVLGIALSIHEGESPQVLGQETVVVYGASGAPDRVGTSVHHATYGSFVQAHRGQAERVHQTLVELLGIRDTDERRPRILDLYGGSGAIALALAQAGGDVHLVESFAPAAAQASEAAREQGLSVHAETSDASAALRRLLSEGASFDAAVTNPPRRGMSPVARELLARLDLPMIAYVSCDPDTLARDLDHLTRLGYSVAALRPLDMIPLTDEVETIALLRRLETVVPRVVYEDAEILIVDKAAHEPTTPQGEYASSLLQRARKLPGAEAAVPVHRLDVGTSGLVMLAKTPELVAKWRAAFNAESSRRIYVAAARGVTPSKGAITRDLREEGKMYHARTRYRRLAVASGHSVLRVVPEQGRTHQIRRHLAAIGHPILGDERYGHAPTNRFFEEKNSLDRTFLHCVRLEFDHPDHGRRMIVEAPMPGDLRAVLERTSGPGTIRFLDQKNALGQTFSTLPPPPDSSPESIPPDSRHVGGLPLDIDSSTPSLRPELPSGDPDDPPESGRL